VDGADENDQTMQVTIGKKCELGERCLPTLNYLDLTDWDLEYKNGTKKPTLQVIDNDMYFVEKNAAGENSVILRDTKSG
jgi:aldose 1-epimerase